MSAGDHGAGFGHFFVTTQEDALDGFLWKIFRIAQYIEGQFWLSAHGIDIGKGIGCRDAAEIIRIIGYRRKHVDGLNDRRRIVDFID